ncbi:MAG: NAD(P)H-hydrate epimerase, partial [Nitrospira sp.]|nr:NAD(P)H-hydrate epimerase [Nitrospira sp.]
MKIVTAAQMQALDRRAIKDARIPSLSLMENAGTAVVVAMEQTFGSLAGKHVLVVCGKGNNGGDGLTIGRLLRRRRAHPKMLLLTRTGELSGDAKTMYRRFVSAGGASAVYACPSTDRIRTLINTSHLIVDALLGTGLSSAVAGPYQLAIEAINQSPGVPVTAVDLPSGIHADTGAVMGVAVRAALTVTFGLPKLGLYVGQGIDHAGKIHVADIGIPQAYAEEVDSQISLTTHQ